MSRSAAQSELFVEPVPAGLSLAEAVVTPEEEAELIAAIDASDLTPFRFHGWLGKRLTASYGWRYDFDDGSFTPGAPIPDWLKPLRVRAASLAGLDPDDLAQALLLRYDPGAGIGWHRDRPVFEHVVGISLGNPATMRFRRRRGGGFDRISVELVPCVAYHLTREARWDWEHSIPAVAARRWSITFRSLSDKGRRRGTAGR
jgi:alkylated DNA repair dioxygenase AlkB